MSAINDPQNAAGEEFIPAPPPPPRDQLSGHEYDGIQEYDNPTPGWWTAVFAATVIFSFFYFVFYHSGVPERSIVDSYSASVSVEAKKTLARLGITELPPPTETNMLLWMARPEFVEYGKGVFKANCTNCHGSSGEGKIGPNMTDDYYKNVTKLVDIPRVVKNGAANGAMPAQVGLNNVDTALVSAYVATLRGQNLPSSPALATPQLGEKIAPWPPVPAATSAPAK